MPDVYLTDAAVADADAVVADAAAAEVAGLWQLVQLTRQDASYLQNVLHTLLLDTEPYVLQCNCTS